MKPSNYLKFPCLEPLVENLIYILKASGMFFLRQL